MEKCGSRCSRFTRSEFWPDTCPRQLSGQPQLVITKYIYAEGEKLKYIKIFPAFQHPGRKYKTKTNLMWQNHRLKRVDRLIIGTATCLVLVE